MTRHADQLDRYKHLREVGFELNNRLMRSLHKGVLDEGGKKLGILKGKVLVFDSEDAMAALMDYCNHDVRRRGVNAIERFLSETPPEPDTDEMAILQALTRAVYSLFIVESLEPGVGVHLRDLFRDEPLFIFDIALSLHGQPGLVLAMRLFAPDGVAMSTGASLPLGVFEPGKLREFVEIIKSFMPGTNFADPSSEDSWVLTTKLIQICLRASARNDDSDNSPPSTAWRSPTLGVARGAEAGRNEPCPCGSGKKYKRCCGAK